MKIDLKISRDFTTYKTIEVDDLNELFAFVRRKLDSDYTSIDDEIYTFKFYECKNKRNKYNLGLEVVFIDD